MTCNQRNTSCQPATCQPCQEVTAHKCKCGDISLPDGRYDNATIVVEGGCITSIEAGELPVYTPDVCCTSTSSSGGSGEKGDQGEKGDPGVNATISIGTVDTLAPGSNATVKNSGTDTNAILDFGIPAGEKGESGASANGITDDTAGFAVEEGNIIGLPTNWPPCLYITTSVSPATVVLTSTKPDSDSGIVTLTLDLSMWEELLYDYIDSADKLLQDQITQLADLYDELDARVTALEELTGGGGG